MSVVLVAPPRRARSCAVLAFVGGGFVCCRRRVVGSAAGCSWSDRSGSCRLVPPRPVDATTGGCRTPSCSPAPRRARLRCGAGRLGSGTGRCTLLLDSTADRPPRSTDRVSDSGTSSIGSARCRARGGCVPLWFSLHLCPLRSSRRGMLALPSRGRLLPFGPALASPRQRRSARPLEAHMNRLSRPLLFTSIDRGRRHLRRRRELGGEPIDVTESQRLAYRSPIRSTRWPSWRDWLGLLLAIYVALVSSVALAAELAAILHMPRLTQRLRRVVDVVAVPALRKRLLEVAAVATVTASSLHAVPAFAATAPPATVMSPVATCRSQSTVVQLGRASSWVSMPSTAARTERVRRVGSPSSPATRCGTSSNVTTDTPTRCSQLVASANPQIVDPNVILVGWTLVLPTRPAETSWRPSMPRRWPARRPGPSSPSSRATPCGTSSIATTAAPRPSSSGRPSPPTPRSTTRT